MAKRKLWPVVRLEVTGDDGPRIVNAEHLATHKRRGWTELTLRYESTHGRVAVASVDQRLVR